MPLNKKRAIFGLAGLLLCVILLAFGCAVRQKPQGGPRDVTPPKLLKATPLNQTHNFHSQIIRLDFDEYFKLVSPFTEINISPAQTKPAEFKVSQKSLIITLKDTLLKNTTYVINFGKAIQDVHESNVLKNFTYVFSTGDHIDSLSISGRVTNVQTQDREKDVTVMLLSLKQDSLYFRSFFGKKPPTMFTTTDTAGNFTITNLHEGLYKLYALKETSPNKIYDNDAELIGIPGHIINLQNDTTNVQLRLFKQVPNKLHVDKKFGDDGHVLLIFNRPVEQPGLRILEPASLNADKPYVEISKTRDTAQMYIRNMDFDSVKIAVYEKNKPIDTVVLRKGRKESFNKFIFITTNTDARKLLKPNTDLLINSSSPISAYEQDLIVLTEDSTTVSDFTLQQDTANRKRLLLKHKWKQNSNYTITFNDGAISGYWGDKSKKLIRQFKIDKPDNYVDLTIHATVPDTSKGYIVELFSDNNILLDSRYVTKKTDLLYHNYLAGKYHVRVVYDDNKNGKWDTGNRLANVQPENIWIDKTVIALKFDTDQDLTIPPEPRP